MLKISVVIPVYNVEKYLSKCLESVINQTYKNLEIICVNDCSPDNSIKILDEYSKKDNRIKIVNREKNGGLSAARNSGIENSTGDYIYFLDSDDWIDPDYIEKMTEAALESKANVIINTAIYTHIDNKIDHLTYGEYKISENRFIKAQDAIYNIMWAACVHLYNRKFLNENNLRFPYGLIYEDMYFQPLVYSKTKEIYAIQKSAYHYIIRENSICTNESKNRNKAIRNHLLIFDKSFDMLEKSGYLKNNAVRILHPDFIVDSENDIETYEIIQKYFRKIQPYFNKTRKFYPNTFCTWFDLLVEDITKAREFNYSKEMILEKLRKNVRNKALSGVK